MFNLHLESFLCYTDDLSPNLNKYEQNLIYCREFISNFHDKFSVQIHVVGIISIVLVRPLGPFCLAGGVIVLVGRWSGCLFSPGGGAE